ncbi:MAG: hypothetical protein WCW65_02640 [Candidatus Paceibacterota bacterium]
MKLLNTIRIFIWLKATEVWKEFLVMLGVVAYLAVLVVLGNVCPIACVLWGIGIPLLAGCIGVIFLIYSITIPWLKQNWKEAKRIAEIEKPIDVIKRLKESDIESTDQAMFDALKKHSNSRDTSKHDKFHKKTVDFVNLVESTHKKAKKSKLVFKGKK